ncbi:MAG: YtxH domain-containing protein [Cyclobacteriaceae bacterium]
MKNLINKNLVMDELINSFYKILKQRLGIDEPPKKKKDNTGLIVSATVLGVLAGVGAGFLFATESGAATRDKLNKMIKEETNQISKFTAEEIDKLNEIAKEQIEKLKKVSK